MEFRSQISGRAEKIQANINGVWKTVGEVYKSGPRMFHARYFGIFGVVGEAVGTWADAYKARKQIEKIANEKIKPENITL